MTDLVPDSLSRLSPPSDAVPYLCCDCLYGGPICDASENEACPRRKEDGSCWAAFTEKEAYDEQ